MRSSFNTVFGLYVAYYTITKLSRVKRRQCFQCLTIHLNNIVELCMLGEV